jgi:hypothetical protein
VLADHYFDRVDAPESEENEDEDDGEPVKRRKIDVREPLYSLEILSERPRMLEYYTGFERSAVDLLIRRFGEVGLRKGSAKPKYPTPAALRKWVEKAPKIMSTDELIDFASKILREPNIPWSRNLLQDKTDDGQQEEGKENT